MEIRGKRGRSRRRRRRKGLRRRSRKRSGKGKFPAYLHYVAQCSYNRN